MSEIMNRPIGQTTLGEIGPLFVLIGVLILFLIFCIVMFIKTSQARKIAMKQQANMLAEKNATIVGKFQHVNGLPVAEGVSCLIASRVDKYEISANGITFDLEKNKVTDICIKTDVDIQKHYVSSVGGAVGGAFLFGPVGAMIGGRAKEKRTSKVFSYLIFTYTSDEEIKHVGFDVTYNLQNAQEFISEFKATKTTASVNISL